MAQNFFATELDRLKERLIAMGGQVENMLDRVIKALLTLNMIDASAVIEADEEVDAQENEIVDFGIMLMATHQPVAKDLRLLLSAFRIAGELERVGDLSVNIARHTKMLAQHFLDWGLPPEISEIATVAQRMISLALDAVSQNDVELAKGVIIQDDQVDKLYYQIKDILLEETSKNPQLIPWGVELISCASHFERLGDHATNLAEDVIFMVKGRNIRHCSKFKLDF